MVSKAKTGKETGLSIADTLKAIEAKFGKGSVMMLNENTAMDVECLPSGSWGLDQALGIGGYPKGRIIEIFGPEASGKTTLALHAVAEAQSLGGICAYIDAENALDPKYAACIGVKNSELVISQPDSGEMALEMVEAMIRSGKFMVIVVDSVASLVPKAEIEGQMGDANVGRHGKLMSQGLRKLAPLVNKSQTVLIFINQIRQSIGVLPGMPTEFTTGGKALKYFASVRIDIRRIAQIKKGEEVVGGRTRIKVVKNKVAVPFKQTELDLMYGEGISKEGEILALGEKYKVVERKGNSYVFGETILGRGYDASRIYLKENTDVAKIIKQKICDQIDIERETPKESEVENNNEPGE